MSRSIPLCSTREEVIAAGRFNSWPYNVAAEAYLAIYNDKMEQMVHIPHSSVFYVRALLESETGYYFPLDKVEAAMIAEGWRGR